MASLSLREGMHEHLLVESPFTKGLKTSLNGQSCLNKSEGYSIKYAFNSHETYWLNGKKLHLAPGESLFINLNYSKAYQFDATNLSRGMCLYYNEEEMLGLFKGLKLHNKIDYTFQSLQAISELRFDRENPFNVQLKTLYEDLSSDAKLLNTKGFESILNQMLMGLDWALIGYNERLREFNPATRQSLIRKVLRARQFMRQNLDRPLVLEDISGHVGMSSFHFQRQYKKATGQSPNRDMVKWRISKAKEYLREGKNSALEISTMLGYNDLPTFSKAFKRETGLSPTKWNSSPKN